MNDDRIADDEIVAALRRLARATDVPRADPVRETALMHAFNRQHPVRSGRRKPRRSGGAWWLSALSAGVAVLVSIVALPGTSGRHPPPGDRSAAHGTTAANGVRASLPVGQFIPWPGAATLPPLESGELVRMDLPVSILPSLGVAPPASHVSAVRADVVIGQDGLARAVRFVGN